MNLIDRIELNKEIEERKLIKIRFMTSTFIKEGRQYFLYTSNLMLPDTIVYWKLNLEFHLNLKY